MLTGGPSFILWHINAPPQKLARERDREGDRTKTGAVEVRNIKKCLETPKSHKLFFPEKMGCKESILLILIIESREVTKS